MQAETTGPVAIESPPFLNPSPEGESRNRTHVRYVRDLERVEQLSPQEKARLRRVSGKFQFRVSDYYLSLINWDDPGDPIRRIVIPHEGELRDWGKLDASNEGRYTVAPGCQHKYPHVALLLVNDVCGAYCRFCFRKRLFMPGNDEVVNDISAGLEYIRRHPEITNVLLTGGDPLLLSTRKLEKIIGEVFAIPHVGIARIGTKMPAFNPFRILDDPGLLAMIETFSAGARRLYFMLHFNHPRELTDAAVEAIQCLGRAGAVMVNQTPLIGGVNDDPKVLAELFRRLSFLGVPPYYVFQCRPTEGNEPFDVPLARSFAIFEKARARVAGLAKRARFVMSHETGKIEVLAMTDEHFYLRYHRSPNPAEETKLMIFPRDDSAYWFDDLLENAAAANN